MGYTIDKLTKMYQFVSTKTTAKTLELARLFAENVYRVYSLPTNIVKSDHDSKLNSHF